MSEAKGGFDQQDLVGTAALQLAGGAAARPAIPYLQRALEQRATIDLKTFAANAQQKISSVIGDLRKNDEGIRVEASVTSIRLGSIAFDSNTLRVIAEAEGTINVAVTSLPNLQ